MMVANAYRVKINNFDFQDIKEFHKSKDKFCKLILKHENKHKN